MLPCPCERVGRGLVVLWAPGGIPLLIFFTDLLRLVGKPQGTVPSGTKYLAVCDPLSGQCQVGHVTGFVTPLKW